MLMSSVWPRLLVHSPLLAWVLASAHMQARQMLSKQQYLQHICFVKRDAVLECCCL